MSPRISPKKTWEGAMASLTASLMVGVLLYNYAMPISSALLNAHLIERGRIVRLAEAAAVADVAAFRGDQCGRAAGRSGGIADQAWRRGKGFGNHFPGHGGMLDRIDALLFAAPVLWYYAAWRVMQ